MIKFKDLAPYYLLSYGNFAETNKLFSLNDGEKTLFPVFTSPESCLSFADEMDNVLAKIGDDRKLQVQVCKDYKNFSDMVLMVSVVHKDIHNLIVDPSYTESDGLKAEVLISILELIGHSSDSSNTSYEPSDS